MTTNQIAYWTLKETERANRAKEKELNRHQVQDEIIRSRQNDITQDLGIRNVNENYRSNTVKELENQRTHLANEQLQALDLARKQRETTGNLEIGSSNAAANMMNAVSNARNAETNAALMQETNRTNLANEQIKLQQLEETNRSNLAKEDIDRFKNVTNYSNTRSSLGLEGVKVGETNRHNLATEYETKRNNLYNQYLEAAGLMETINNNASRNKISSANLMPNVNSRLSAGGLR